MAKQLQLRRGTTAQHSAFTGALGEVTVDTDKKVVVVHDGSTAGGIPLAKQTTVDTKVDKITSTDNAIARYDGTGGAIQNSSVVIDDTGNVLVGTTSITGASGVGASFKADSNGRRLLQLGTSTTATNILVEFFNPNGAVGRIETSASSTFYSTSSDYRLKENIQPMQNALGVVAQLNPVTYTWKADGSDGQGFIAHELQAVVPDCVTGEKDAVDAEGKPVYQGVDTSFLVATLTKAIQELKAEVDDLKTQLEAK